MSLRHVSPETAVFMTSQVRHNTALRNFATGKIRLATRQPRNCRIHDVASSHHAGTNPAFCATRCELMCETEVP